MADWTDRWFGGQAMPPHNFPHDLLSAAHSSLPLTKPLPNLEKSDMATEQNNQICNTLVQKLTTGVSLDEAEKSHLANCDDCMADVVRKLDELGATASAGRNGDLTHARPSAKKALEHGRSVFEREFGISLSKK